MGADQSQEAKIAVLERTVELQDREIVNLRSDIKEMREASELSMKEMRDGFELKLNVININVTKMIDTMNQAKGGWRMLMLIGGVSATFGALVVEGIKFLKGHP